MLSPSYPLALARNAPPQALHQLRLLHAKIDPGHTFEERRQTRLFWGIGQIGQF